MNLNEHILEVFNQFAGKSHVLDKTVMDIVNYLPLLMCAVIVLIYIIGFVRQRPDLRIGAVHATVSLVINLILAFIIGHVFFETRPMFAHKNLNLPATHVNDSSFPSDHATVTMTLALGAFPLSKFLGWIYIVCSIVVCAGKVYLAEHYPFDILLTYALVIVMRFIYAKLLAKPVQKIYFVVESIIYKPEKMRRRDAGR